MTNIQPGLSIWSTQMRFFRLNNLIILPSGTPTLSWPRLRPHQLTARIKNISTSHTAEREFLIQVPDFPDSSANRARAQPSHAQETQPLVESGHLTLGSVVLRKHPNQGEKRDVVGSVMIIKAESEEAIRKLLAEDAYTKEGAWDIRNAKIWAIETGIRTAL